MPDQPCAVPVRPLQDRVVEDGGALRFAERLCIYNSTIVPTSLVLTQSDTAVFSSL